MQTSLAGKVLFITGASRGIGKAIGLKAAKDGAKVVVVAKTKEPHPKLPGTIFTAAQEMNDAGGQGLAVCADIRNEQDVTKAVEATVSEFGGIDIVVNNASAISLTGTAATPMKRYDLMHGVNGRGTFLTTQACLPHLEKSDHAHILTISPPLNLNPRWFKNHVAYTTAKYNMSMNALGWAEEFREKGIASNCLWPRTAIETAAMEMLGGAEALDQCRTVDIMADSAHYILRSDPREYTGRFLIDEEVLQQFEPSVDLDKYAVNPDAKLMPDFFLDAADYEFSQQAPNQAVNLSNSESNSASPVAQLFTEMEARMTPETVKKVNGTYRFDVKDGSGKVDSWLVDLKSGSGSIENKQGEADCTIEMSEENLIKLAKGKLNPQMAFFSGKLSITGNVELALKLSKILK